MSTTEVDDIGTRCSTGDLAEVEAAVMRRLEQIEQAMEDRPVALERHAQVLDDLLREMSQMCGYLANVADRLRANS